MKIEAKYFHMFNQLFIDVLCAQILMESEQLRKENDTSGPQDELEYWKKRGAQFSQLLDHLQVHKNWLII